MIVLDDEIDRDQMIIRLAAKGIESNYGAYAVLSTQYYRKKYGALYKESLLNSERLYKHGLCLPLHQSLLKEDVQYIAKLLEE